MTKYVYYTSHNHISHRLKSVALPAAPSSLRLTAATRVDQENDEMMIEMIHRRFGYFPRIFRINSVEHEVIRVTRCWTVGTRKGLKRHYFDVVCLDGQFMLYQELTDNTWHIAPGATIG